MECPVLFWTAFGKLRRNSLNNQWKRKTSTRKELQRFKDMELTLFLKKLSRSIGLIAFFLMFIHKIQGCPIFGLKLRLHSGAYENSLLLIFCFITVKFLFPLVKKKYPSVLLGFIYAEMFWKNTHIK